MLCYYYPRLFKSASACKLWPTAAPVQVPHTSSMLPYVWLLFGSFFFKQDMKTNTYHARHQSRVVCEILFCMTRFSANWCSLTSNWRKLHHNTAASRQIDVHSLALQVDRNCIMISADAGMVSELEDTTYYFIQDHKNRKATNRRSLLIQFVQTWIRYSAKNPRHFKLSYYSDVQVHNGKLILILVLI